MVKQICTQGVWDSTVPGIIFNEEGVSNYAVLFEKLVEINPRNAESKKKWQSIVEEAKKRGKNKDYDCIVGVSGGTDSSYLLHLLVKEYHLRPLAVTVDNGWNSRIAVENIKRMTSALNVDLETLVIDYDEMKNVLSSFIKASYPWIDAPTDHAIRSVLFNTANREGIKHIFHGSDFRTEGTQPIEWTHCDAKMIRDVVSSFGTIKLKKFPVISIYREVYLNVVKGVKQYRPFYFLDYRKKDAKVFLTKEYGWEDYGGHHHENAFTKFAISYWLPEKFGIEKRIVTNSALVMSKELKREEALEELSRPAYDPETIQDTIAFVRKKLDMSEEVYEKSWQSPNADYKTYKSYLSLVTAFKGLFRVMSKRFLSYTPMTFLQEDIREQMEANNK